eukprot:CAMPEP_0171290816 /NCGR_PEP_ID=MMETSP0790-20130122/71339_1 /TAXON_ID=2925 /ORGANISM="Alexandrium catenella, Strain OF101" /LENGTH=80 /DNA_ID=CAMNT_0011760535 /DNA_START=72 /DNA_END=310 /DNA_ORIENTATION=+
MKRSIVLCFCCRALGALALRKACGAPPGAAEDGVLADGPPVSPFSLGKQGSGAVPSVKQFAEEWEQLRKADEPLREPLPA